MSASRRKVRSKWRSASRIGGEFVEACFTPGSELNRRLKQMILNMGEEEKHK